MDPSRPDSAACPDVAPRNDTGRPPDPLSAAGEPTPAAGGPDFLAPPRQPGELGRPGRSPTSWGRSIWG